MTIMLLSRTFSAYVHLGGESEFLYWRNFLPNETESSLKRPITGE